MLLELYRYPAEYWIHLRSESDRVDLPRCHCARKAMPIPGRRMAMVYKLIDAAEARCEPPMPSS